MKLLTRISSIRRIAWNACRSCSPDSCSMCPDSLARCRDAGWTRSPAAASTRVTGSWASQSISRSGSQRAQLLGDREVAPGVAEADRRGEVERPRPPACVARHPGADRRGFDGGGASDSANARISRLTSTGSRAGGPWPAPSTRIRRAAGQLGEPLAVRRCPRTWSSVPCSTVTGQRTSAHSGSMSVQTAPSQPSRPAVVSTRVCGATVAAPRHGVLDLLGRVRLVEHLREEEPQEVVVVALEPVVPVVLRPAPARGRSGSSHERRRGRSAGSVKPHGGRDREEPAAPARGGRPPRAPTRRRRRRARPARPGRRRRRPSPRRCRRRTPRWCTPPHRRGRPDAPLPRPSKVTTRKCRAR